MSIPYPYRIEGASGSYNSDINGYRFTVTIILDQVLGTNDIAQMFNSLTDSNVPLIGSDLSGVNLDLTGCWLRDIDCNPIGNGQSRLALHYQQSPFNDVQISTQTQVSQVESNKDKDGDSITTVYKYPADYGGDEPTEREQELRGTFSDKIGGTFSKLVPESTRTYTLREAEDGDAIAREYVGTVNDALWQNGEAGTWMLTNVTGLTDNSQQSPENWVNSYTFQYRSDGWDPEVVHVDANTNQPVPDPQFSYAPEKPVEFGGSKVQVEAYKTKDFTDLFPA
jgi:hypothetical protein